MAAAVLPVHGPPPPCLSLRSGLGRSGCQTHIHTQERPLAATGAAVASAATAAACEPALTQRSAAGCLPKTPRPFEQPPLELLSEACTPLPQLQLLPAATAVIAVAVAVAAGHSGHYRRDPSSAQMASTGLRCGRRRPPRPLQAQAHELEKGLQAMPSISAE